MARPRRVSLHDPDARPIAMGRLGKPVEFGHKAQLVERDYGVIVDHDVERGNPADAQVAQRSATTPPSGTPCAPWIYRKPPRFFDFTVTSLGDTAEPPARPGSVLVVTRPLTPAPASSTRVPVIFGSRDWPTPEIPNRRRQCIWSRRSPARGEPVDR
jgi:hypothetical protein